MHLSIDVQSGCFYLLVVVNCATTNIEVQVPLWNPVFILLDMYPQAGLLAQQFYFRGVSIIVKALSGTTIYSSFILHSSFLTPGIGYFSKELWFFLMKNI
jgi:hypothetical protein